MLNHKPFFGVDRLFSFSSKNSPPAFASVMLSKKNDSEEKPRISDDLYDRIPDQFKHPSEPISSDSIPETNCSDSTREREEDAVISPNDIQAEPASQEKPQEDSQEKSEIQKTIQGAPSSSKNETPPPSFSTPNHFRRVDSEKKEHDSNDHGKPSHPIPSTPPRSSFPFLFYLILFGLIGYVLYNMYSGSKSTEISWTGFNTLLEQGEIREVNLKGNQLTGTLKTLPTIDELSEILPNSEAFFKTIVQKVDPKMTPKEFNDLLKKPSNSFVITPSQKESSGVSRSYEITYLKKGKDASPKPIRTGKSVYLRFSCEVPTLAFADQDLDTKIRAKTESYTASTPTDNTGMLMFFSIIVSVIIFVALFRMMRRTNEQMMGGGGFSAFNRSPAKRYDPNNQPVTFNDVAGLENVKNELVEIVDFLKNPEKYQRMGARVPKGTLLFGPPGTGKTLLGRAVAGEAGVPFFSINGSEFIQMFVGVGASRVRELFNAAKENAPAILFIDEIDAVGRHRGTGVGGGHDEREQTLNQILSEMDGFTQNESVMVMAATNRPDVLDPALMRPGRFDRHITVDRPSLKGRVDIFCVYLKKIPYDKDVDVDKLARSTVGFTGADIRNLVNEATLWATRNNKNVVSMSDFDFAHEKVIMGLKREEVISDDEKRKTAYHEAGHTILGWFSNINSKVFKVTIIPRGQSLGATYFFPEEEQVNINQTQIQAMLVRYLGGRAAEKLVYQETSAGAENDLKEATRLARRMVIHWGMSEKLGPIAFRAAESSPFLGREITEYREYSEATAKLIDEEIVRIMRQADHNAMTTLTEKRDLLEKLTDALVDEEELDQNRIAEILGPQAGTASAEASEIPVADLADTQKDSSGEDSPTA